MASRKARPAVVDVIAAFLPETEKGASWGDRAELAEVITDAWLAVAPKKLAKAYLADA